MTSKSLLLELYINIGVKYKEYIIKNVIGFDIFYMIVLYVFSDGFKLFII